MFDALRKMLGFGGEQQGAKPASNMRRPAAQQVAPAIDAKIPYLTPGGKRTDMKPAYMDKPVWEQQLLRPQGQGGVSPGPGAPRYNNFQTIDNEITNDMVDQGQLPAWQREMYPQQNQGQYSLQEELKNSFYPKVRY